MRVENPAVARPDAPDRGAAVATIGYAGQNITFHAETSRVSYTVPTGKKAVIQHLSATIWCVDIANAPYKTRATWYLTPNGGSAVSVLFAETNTSTLGDSDHKVTAGPITLLEGDKIELQTLNNGLDDFDYHGSAVILEYDA